MKEAFIFDVDGTLTPSRQAMTDEFREFFVPFAQTHEVHLVSGSDYAKTVEQLGKEIVDSLVQTSYNCSGNSVWKHGVEIYSSPWKLPKAAYIHLMDILYITECPTQTGNHLEARPGAVNFSTVGRNANIEQRAEYVKFDKATGEREKIAEIFNTCFGSKFNCTALIGGETGVDITETGKDKRQVINDFNTEKNFRFIHFFGDRTTSGGNDWPLAKAVWDHDYGTVYQVNDWHDTLKRLTNLC